MSGNSHTSDDSLRAFAGTLKSVGVTGIAVYVLLSLGSALVGSLAAILLLPLVQPGHALPIGGGLFDVQGGTDVHALVFAGATIAFALLRWQAARQGARLAGRYGMHLRRSVHARLIDAPLSSLADATSAEIANVLTYNIEIITQGFNALLLLLVAGVTAIVSVGLALWVSPPLMLAAPMLAGFGLIASRISSREQAQVSRQYVADLTRLFWLSEDFPRRLRHVRSFEKEQAEKDSYGDISERLRHGYQRQLYLIASGRLMLELLGAVGIAAIFILAYRLHGVDQASLIAVCLLLGRLLPYLVSTRQSFQQLRAAVPAFELWQRYMHRHPSQSSNAHSHELVADQALHIERVQLLPPLDALDIGELVLWPGQLTLVSGDSGIGKSSLVDVLAGMAAPREFAARIGGRAMDFDAYCQFVRRGAYISQSVRPWQRSIRECLRWAAPDASDAVLLSALEDVGLAKRLDASGRGLDSALDNASSKLSGGELQRLLLAQVILREPRLALLDEATSALDVASEIRVLSQLRRRLPHTILIVVSHRPDVIAIADQCLVIRQDCNRVAGVA
ncbi:ATP-binding cassette domain-containing protein [Dyella flava]|uniref:ABC transporter ATP-binding protein n=1 Tax=Dyella flava TaxID=1920170 RepID=A0ABS2K197_9GAMM|nr:ABC transporter ATP-binding protein [Dyella flava]MBM7125012.1 ABC transporter ATP-binding protein [Dyella flava]GLQ49969.1 ABC transporter ATP-binding protein [Dyella flava]